MPGMAVIGAQWGDEGKGKVVDALASQADFVVRYSGGANAGHTIVVGQEVFKLHHLPCGILHDQATSILGGGMAINPWTFQEEYTNFANKHDPGEIYIAKEAHLVLPHQLKNDEGGGSHIGTTKRGIGPNYSDRARRVGLRFEDLFSDDVLLEQLERLLAAKPNSTARVNWETKEQAFADLAGVREFILPFVRDTGEILRKALRKGVKVLFEGGQGTMLDLNYGTYPYVTSSHPTVGGILIGAGVSHKALNKVYGVVKAFTSRVGHGPFITELEGEIADTLRGTGKNQWDEYGTTTGRPRRVGWLDLVQLKYACELNGFDGLIVTKLDVLSGLDNLKVCVEYKNYAPVFKDMPGWGELQGLGKREALPKEALAYIDLVENFTETPVVMFSTSPDRADTYGEVSWF